MSKGEKLVPELRFPEFVEPWEIITLSDACNVLRGSTFSKSDINENGSESCIHYGELFTKYNEIISVVFSRTNVNNGFRSKIGDILMPSSDVTPDGLAKASSIALENVILGGDMNILRPKTNINSIFLSYLLNHSKREIIKLVSGTTVKHIYPSQIATCTLTVAHNKNEQQKIASCLSSLDELIAAEGQKLDALKEHKKGLMQQLFPAKGEKVPQLRFKEFEGSGEWGTKTFNQLFEIGNGRDYKHLGKGDIPVYGTGGYMLSVDDYLYDGESACIGRKGTIDKPVFLTGKFWTVDTLFYTHSFVDCFPKFVFLLFQNINWLEYNEAGGVPSLSKTIIQAIEVQVPKPDEQQMIVDFVSSLDELITAQAEKIQGLELHKKGLMQGMFPQTS